MICLIDGDFIPYYICHNKKGDEEKTLDDCKKLTDDFITNILKYCKATGYIMCLTVGKCFRYQVFEGYKANRKYTGQPIYLSDIKQYLVDKYSGIHCVGLEADDIVNIIKKDFDDKNIKSIIVSPDKDILMLQGKHFNPRLMRYHVTNKNKAHVFFWRSMITGDTIDGIKGVPGKGKVASADIVKEDNKLFPNPCYVLEAYIKYYGEDLGVREFNKNYSLLKILDKYDGFVIPDITRVEYGEVGIEEEIQGTEESKEE